MRKLGDSVKAWKSEVYNLDGFFRGIWLKNKTALPANSRDKVYFEVGNTVYATSRQTFFRKHLS